MIKMGLEHIQITDGRGGLFQYSDFDDSRNGGHCGSNEAQLRADVTNIFAYILTV
jgi:hypothetical protein